MIERVYVHNYRCFENFTLDLTGRKSALLIGKNGAGKSTLRHALGVIRSIGRGPYHVKEWIDQSHFSQRRRDRPMRFEVAVVLTNKRFDYVITFEYSHNIHETRILDEKLSVDGDMVYSRQRNQVTLSTGTTFFLDTRVGALAIINERQGEGFIQQLKSFFASMLLLSPAPLKMSGFAEEESFELQEDASNFAAWLSAVLARFPARYNDIAKYIQFVIPDFASFQFVSHGERGKQLTVTFENKKELDNHTFTLDFTKLSDGEKSFFLSALIVAFNRPESPVFCFWDEPDNHLSLSEIGHFITELRRLGNQNGQFIATSHHPETIRRFSDESTLVLTRSSHLEPTVVRPLTQFKYKGDLIEELIRNEVIG